MKSPSDAADLNLKVTVRNGRLLRAIRDKFGSVAALCRAAGISPQQASALVCMRINPFRQDGTPTSAAEAMVSALGIPADELWPAHLARLRAKQATVELDMSVGEFAALADPESRAVMRQAIARWSRGMSDRHATALSMHVSGATLEEIGAELGGVSRERARQVVLKAERDMRRRAYNDGVRSFRELMG